MNNKTGIRNNVRLPLRVDKESKGKLDERRNDVNKTYSVGTKRCASLFQLLKELDVTLSWDSRITVSGTESLSVM